MCRGRFGRMSRAGRTCGFAIGALSPMPLAASVPERKLGSVAGLNRQSQRSTRHRPLLQRPATSVCLGAPVRRCHNSVRLWSPMPICPELEFGRRTRAAHATGRQSCLPVHLETKSTPASANSGNRPVKAGGTFGRQCCRSKASRTSRSERVTLRQPPAAWFGALGAKRDWMWSPWSCG